ncbi:MAG: roadblock/LC7 domain-containing protein [Promethearchaeota archaeon]
MDENLSEDKKLELTELLRKLEARTELEACAVVSKEGMRIACAVGAELDADVYSAASAALVNLGETTLKQLRHGTLKEIIVRGDDGYTILTSAGEYHMIVGSCKNMSRMGYYLALLHRFSNKTAQIMGYMVKAPTPIPTPAPMPAVAGPTAASLLEESMKTSVAPEATPPKQTKVTPKSTYIKPPLGAQVQPEPASEAISEALKVLNPLEEPLIMDEPEPLIMDEPEPLIMDEPESLIMDEPESLSSAGAKQKVDKGVLFDALQALGPEKEPTSAVQPTSKVETQALMNALKPQPSTTVPFSGQAAPSNKQTSVPFAKQSPAAKGIADDDLFKISDKEAVLEALKVLGWEEPEEK